MSLTNFCDEALPLCKIKKNKNLYSLKQKKKDKEIKMEQELNRAP